MVGVKQSASLFGQLLRDHVPGQLVVQMTDRCNAHCPQCGMRVTAAFKRRTLPHDELLRTIDAAAKKGIQAISFTGGEPLMELPLLLALIQRAGDAGIPYIRTGTNGFLFQGSHKPTFYDLISRLAEKLAQTPLRNFWISIDSAYPVVHETMRGFEGVIDGIAKAIPIFHQHGLYPSANLGINRNIGGRQTRFISYAGNSEAAYLTAFQRAFEQALRRFYQLVKELGFTIVNTCYPMSIESEKVENGTVELAPVYAATATDALVRFTRLEKAALFQAVKTVIPEFRNQVRIFSPLCALYRLCGQYKDAKTPQHGCRGGKDFYFIAAQDGNTYPCGYRGRENLGKFWDLPIADNNPSSDCRQCDWECFIDPSELFAPLLDAAKRPVRLGVKITSDPHFYRLWQEDLRYYRTCDYFNGRRQPNLKALNRFGRHHGSQKADLVARRKRQSAI